MVPASQLMLLNSSKLKTLTGTGITASMLSLYVEPDWNSFMKVHDGLAVSMTQGYFGTAAFIELGQKAGDHPRSGTSWGQRIPTPRLADDTRRETWTSTGCREVLATTQVHQKASRE
jgi:hypothetical protein